MRSMRAWLVGLIIASLQASGTYAAGMWKQRYTVRVPGDPHFHTGFGAAMATVDGRVIAGGIADLYSTGRVVVFEGATGDIQQVMTTPKSAWRGKRGCLWLGGRCG